MVLVQSSRTKYARCNVLKTKVFSTLFLGRTDGTIKNHWNGSLKLKYKDEADTAMSVENVDILHQESLD